MSSRTEKRRKENNNGHILGIQIGSVCCGLRCKEDDDFDRLQRLYHDFPAKQPIDINIDLEATDRVNPDDMGSIMSGTVFTHEDNQFRSSSRVVAGSYDLTNRFISITGERSLTDPKRDYNHLNRLIALAYYSACKVKYNGSAPPALLLHCCGIIRNGRAILFSGPSETGKTSIAHMCGEQYGTVLNDEMVLITRPTSNGNGISAQGAPILGGYSTRQNTTVPLSFIMMMKRGDQTAVHNLNKADAYLRLMRQVITPAYIGQKGVRDVYSLMADFSSEVAEAIPIYELEFNLDEKALWQIVTEIEETLERGNNK